MGCCIKEKPKGPRPPYPGAKAGAGQIRVLPFVTESEVERADNWPTPPRYTLKPSRRTEWVLVAAIVAVIVVSLALKPRKSAATTETPTSLQTQSPAPERVFINGVEMQGEFDGNARGTSESR